MRGREIVARLSELTRQVALGEVKRPQLAEALRELAKSVDSQQTLFGEPSASVTDHRAAWERVFAYWQRVMEKPKARPTAERRRKVIQRLRDGYSEEEIKRAIDGCASSEYHQGGNDGGKRYDDLELICRNGTQLEKFREMAGDGGSVVESAPGEAAILKAADEALAAGDVEAYEDAQSRIRKLRSRGRAAEKELGRLLSSHGLAEVRLRLH